MGYIGKVDIGGTQHLVASTLYGTCSSLAEDSKKIVDGLDNVFNELITGVTIHVKFTNSNTYATPTLQVGSTTAKQIRRYGTTKPGTTAASSWNAGAVVSFTYDGTYWQMNDWLNTNTNTWRNVYVNGTPKLGTGTGTGSLNFLDGTNTTVSYNNGVKIDATDEKVKQTNNTDNNNYRLLLSNSDNNGEETAGVKKSGNLIFNPSSQILTVPNVNINNGNLTLGSQGKQGILTLYTPNSSIAETVTISSQSHGHTNINHYLPTNTPNSYLLNTAYIDNDDISINSNGLLKVRNLAETLIESQVISRDTIIPDSNNPYSDDTRTVIIDDRPVIQNFSISLGSLDGYVLIIYGRPYDSSNHYLENIGSKIVHKDFFWKATQSSSPTNICLSLIGDIGNKVYIRKKAYNIVKNDFSFIFNPVSGSGRTVTIDGSSVSTSSNDNCLILYALIEIQVNE